MTLEYTVVSVTLSFAHPGTDAAQNYGAFCQAGSGQGFNDIMDDAIAQAALLHHDMDFDHFDFQAVVFPHVPGCFGACASTPGSSSWYNGVASGGEALRGVKRRAGTTIFRHCEERSDE